MVTVHGAPLERVEEAPKPDAHAVGEGLFLRQVALTGRLHRGHFPEPLGLLIAVLDGEFRALLKIDRQRNGYARPVWPHDLRALAPVAD